MLLALLALLASARVAGAEDVAPAEASAARTTGVIALLPLSADAKLKLYGQPVAAEVARALERAGFTIVVVSNAAPVPSKARLVIDGRIVRGAGETVLLEARVRDPALGTIIASLSATAPSLTRIDQGAAELVLALEPALRRGIAAQELAARARGATTTGARAPVAGELPEPGDATTRVDPRPRAVVVVGYPAALEGGADAPVLRPLLRAGADRLAALVGHRSEAAQGEDLVAAVTAQGAALGVSITLLSIRYEGDGVITARARGRVRVVAAGQVIFDRVVRTDTLVGGRGDRKDAVARAAIDQIVDIAYGRVRAQLEAAP